jgi:hypothetical protein
MRALGLALLLAGCAPMPAWLVDPERSPHPDCPPARFAVAVGSSRAGRADAEAQARAAIVRRLGSRIEVETDRVLSATRTGDEVTVRRSLDERVHDQAAFGHGELVRAVGPSYRRGGETFVLACLDREAAAGALRRDLAAPLERFDAAAERAHQAAVDREAPAFVVAWQAARAEVPAIAPLLGQLRALSDAPAPEEARFRARAAWIEGEAARLRTAVKLYVRATAPDVPAAQQRTLLEAVRDAARALGFTTELAGADAACPRLGPAAYLLDAEAHADCAWRSLGNECRLEVLLRAQSCAAGRTVFESGLPGTLLRGIDLRDGALALRKAFRDVVPATFEPALRRGFLGELPMGP